MRKSNLTKRLSACISFAIMFMLLLGFTSNAYGQATSITSTGFRANQGGGGALTTEWTTGNLGNTWHEGEWVPYQLIISNVQTDYPNMQGFPDIVMSYDFTSHDERFVDLVRSIQFGYTQLTNAQGWVQDDGSPYPMTTRTEIELASRDFGNTPPLENVWTGFTLLNLPDSQMNRALDLSIGTPTDAERTFYITRQDLIDAGIDSTTNTIIIYYQLHESRTFIWSNSLQKYYSDDFTPGAETDGWGGYVYSMSPFDTDARNGSGYVPGSSGHIEVEFGGGAKTVPIPIPEQLPGIVSGLKWSDENGNGLFDGSETTLSGWRIYVEGTLEGIFFSSSTLTDGSGNYSFPNLTSDVIWTIFEDAQQESPMTTGWMQTYPQPGDMVGVGTGVAIPPDPDYGANGWDVALTEAIPNQADMNFGNKQCTVAIACPPNVDLDCTESTDPSNTGYPVIEGNCPPFDTAYTDTQTPGSCPQNYTITRLWVVTDDNGISDSCEQIITVTDDTPPVISCPSDLTFECDAVGDFGFPTATDDCDAEVDIVLDSRDSIPGNCPQEYQLVLTYIATDDCGNADTCQQSITVQDTTPPEIVCADDLTFECDAVGDFGFPTASDNCDTDVDIVLDSRDSIPGNCPQEYQLLLTYIATDDCGNADTCQQTITVEDTTPPVISCPDDQTFECDAVGDFGFPTASDNCDTDVDIALDSRDSIPGDCPQEYQLLLTYIATDDCGNADTCQQSITVEDTTPPEIVCADDLTFECDAVGDFGFPTASDNCDTDVDIVLDSRDSIPGNCPQNYQLLLTYIATDDCGNADTCQQSITVEDTTPPVIVVPADASFNCDFGDPGSATATDNCDEDVDVTYVDDTTSTTCPLQIVRTWVATDDCGNADTGYQNIEVIDETPPVIVCPDDATFECDAVGEFGYPTATDNCGTPDISLDSRDSIPGDCPNEYQLVLTYIATDACGNADTCAQTITVEDTTPPELTCPDNLTFECDAVGDFGSPSATDNCDPEVDIVLDSRDSTAGNCPQDYTLVLTYIATDDCGNADTCQQTITVEDTTPPVISCAPQDTIDCEEDLVFTPPTAEDNCDLSPSIVEVSVDTVSGPGDGEFTYTKTWYAEDACGNQSDECSQTIIRLACPQEFCTFTQGGWGSGCPDSQAGDMYSTQPGCIRDHYFDTVFPDGVYIGSLVGNYAAWTSAAAVEAYLPAGSTPGVLVSDMTDPLTTPAGVLGGQLLALKINREFSCAGIFYDLAMLDVTDCFGDYVIADSCGGPFAGLTVDQFIALADQAVSGNVGVLDPYGASLSDLNFTATCLNEFFDNCGDDTDYTFYSAPVSVKVLPDHFSLEQNKPNPFNPETEISFALPEGSNVKLEIYNIMGQKVETLVDDYRDAGTYTVIWDGSRAASGIYFYRLTANQFVETKKMVLVK